MATNTKKQLEEDFTNQPQATSAADVNNQDARTRLWQSLNYSYGKQRDESNKSYDQAVSQADRSALARGMQRSSYNMQTQANLLNQKVKAENDIYNAQIADYQNRIGEIEQQELENEWRQKEFDEKVRQYDEGMAFQQAESERDQGNRDREYEANRADTAWSQNQQELEFAFKQKQWETQQDQWREEFDYSKMSDRQKLLFSYVETALQQGKDVSDALLAEIGMTRSDFKAMSTDVKNGYSGGYSGGGTKKATTNTDSGTPATTTDTTPKGLTAAIESYFGNNPSANNPSGNANDTVWTKVRKAITTGEGWLYN
jgi:hypothetical protein